MWILAHLGLMLIWVPLHLHPHNVPVILILTTLFFTYFSSITAPASGKKNSDWSAGGNCISSAKVVGFPSGSISMCLV